MINHQEEEEEKKQSNDDIQRNQNHVKDDAEWEDFENQVEKTRREEDAAEQRVEDEGEEEVETPIA